MLEDSYSVREEIIFWVCYVLLALGISLMAWIFNN